MPAAPQAVTVDWQEHLDLLMPRKDYLRPDEVAAALRIDVKTVGHLFEPDATRRSGPVLGGFTFNARGTGERPHKRILRASVLLLLMERSNYTPAEFRARMLEVLGRCPVRDLVFLQTAIAELIRRKQA